MENATRTKITRETGTNPSAARIRWENRDRELIDFVSEHPATTEQIARTFFSSTTLETARKKASRRIRRLCRKRLVHAVGMAQLRGTGRPQYVYCYWQPSIEMLEHEIWLTEFRLLFRQFPFQRSVPIGKAIADGLLTIKETKFFIEIDMGTMSNRQMQEKWERWKSVKDYLLVICLSEGRMNVLRAHASKVQTIALFTTFTRLRSGVPEPWVDYFGKTMGI